MVEGTHGICSWRGDLPRVPGLTRVSRAFCAFSVGAWLTVAAALLPVSAVAQVPDSLTVEPLPQEVGGVPVDSVSGRVSPRGAFIRSALVPGWGHARVGAFVRGGFYFSAEAASAIMIFKTQTRIRTTDQRLAVREAALRARLEAQGITDPVEVENALAEDPEYEDLTQLRETRADQREDWIALGLFLMLIGGVDAYVSAHLADFPAPVVIEPDESGRLEVGFSLPVGF